MYRRRAKSESTRKCKLSNYSTWLNYLLFNRLLLHVPADPLTTKTAFPDVTFLGEAQVKDISSNTEQYDFDNGVELTVPSCALRPDSVCSVSVQPGFAPEDVFELPKGVRIWESIFSLFQVMEMILMKL